MSNTTGLPGLWANTPSPVAVQAETDLGNFGQVARTFPPGIPCYAKDTQICYIWDPDDITSPFVTGSTVPVSVNGVQIGTWHAISGVNSGTLDLSAVVGVGLSLKQIIPIGVTTASVRGYYAAGDGGSAGLYWWNPVYAGAANDGTIVRPTAALIGAWFAIFTGPVYGNWFGMSSALGDNSTALTAAFTASQHVKVAPGNYPFNVGFTHTLRGRTLEMDYGASFSMTQSFINDATDFKLFGKAFGENFNSDGISTWRPNFIWTGANNGNILVASNGASADGFCAQGIFCDANGHTGVQAIRLGSAGFGCSGLDFNNTGSIDCFKGLNVRAAVEISEFYENWHIQRANATQPAGSIGLMMGADAAYDGGITTVRARGGCFQGFETGAQAGGSAGRPAIIFITETVFEDFPAGGVGINLFDVFGADVSNNYIETVDPTFTNRGIKIGHAGGQADNVSIRDNYIDGWNVAIEGYGWDGLVSSGNMFEMTNADGTHLAIVFKNIGTGTRRQSGSWMPQRRIGRGLNYSADIDSQTGFDFAWTQNRDSASTDQPYQTINNGTLTVTAINGSSFLGPVAWCANYAIQSIANTSPIQVTTTNPNQFKTGMTAALRGTASLDGEYTVTQINANTFSLNGSVASGAFGAVGNATSVADLTTTYAAFDWTQRSGFAPTWRISDGVPFQILPKSGASTAGVHPHVIGGLLMRSTYWDGAASQNFDLDLVPVVDSEAPFKAHGSIQVNAIDMAQFSNDIADTQTALLLRRNVGGVFTVQRVSMGAADSGGAGFKLLRVPN